MDCRTIAWKVALIMLPAVLLCGMLFSCQPNEQAVQRISFIGDSHVAFWDVQYDFPGYLTHNYGKKGAGIEYLKSFEGQFSNETVILVIGTNDVDLFRQEGSEIEYVADYMDAITALNAQEIAVVSIFPLSEVGVNHRIQIVNEMILGEVRKRGFNYVDVYELFSLNGYLNPRYTDDGRHLNREGYLYLTREIKQVLWGQ